MGRHMKRTIAVIAMTVALIAGSATAALAHPPSEDGHPGQANGFDSEPALGAVRLQIEKGNAKALNGIVQGYVVHSPACLGHDDG